MWLRNVKPQAAIRQDGDLGLELAAFFRGISNRVLLPTQQDRP